MPRLHRVVTRSESVRQLKEAVRRDIEWLLNTRRIAEPADPAFVEVQESLYHYGIPDITSLSADSRETRKRLERYLSDAVIRFEPRLRNVRVTVTDSGESHVRHVRFVVEGLLQIEPTPEQVAFDTVLEISSGEFQVKRDGYA